MTRIVVGVDGSPSSRAALVWALDEARVRGCRVDAVAAVHHGYGAAARRITPSGESSVQAQIVMDEIDRVLSSNETSDIAERQPYLAEPSPASVLIDESLTADLLVVGRRGAGLISGLFIGSVADQVVRHAHCTVAVIADRLPDGA
ncbi:MAG: universal stress protein [Acidimicrobiia bacterium]